MAIVKIYLNKINSDILGFKDLINDRSILNDDEKEAAKEILLNMVDILEIEKIIKLGSGDIKRINTILNECINEIE